MSGRKPGAAPPGGPEGRAAQGKLLTRWVKHWSLTTLRERLIKIGAKVVCHARYVIFQLVEEAVPQRLFAAILDRIRRLGLPEIMPR